MLKAPIRELAWCGRDVTESNCIRLVFLYLRQYVHVHYTGFCPVAIVLVMLSVGEWDGCLRANDRWRFAVLGCELSTPGGRAECAGY